MGLQGRRPHPNARLDLDVTPKAAELSEVRSALARLPLPDPLLADARLLVSELLTNSIRHAGLGPTARIRVIARVSDERLRVDVIDGRRTTMPRASGGRMRPTPVAESGWGLFLVETLASRWGLGPDRHWFELDLEREREPAR